MTEKVARRIMILGGSGSGKTWLTFRLGEISGLPMHHLDQMNWRPGFQRRRTPRLTAMTREIHAGPEWIFEGGHYETGAERAARADALIWIEVGGPLRVLRVTWRALRFSGKVRPAMSPGCVEHFGRHTLNVIRFALRSVHRQRPKIEEIIAGAPPHLTVIRLRSARQTRRFLRACRPAPDGPGLILPN